ncbi:hypothetical protein LOD99_6764 [Oopsacas minuta]|uniref:Uncharacterized protein n=1 Tax=Oopsacas minuta TaxID=111878 RepID=A0AAV7JLN4_9METZ|nr:hypothetical protein LOD99_6764 [Oopsacas minuta]
MAEKVTSQTGFDNIYPHKRKIYEKEDINFITLDIDKVCLSEVVSYTLIESVIPTWSKPGQWPDCFSEPEMKLVEMPIIDQYVRLLMMKSRVFKLEDSEYVIITDYDHSQKALIPDLLMHLLTATDPRGRASQEKIRAYNRALASASLGTNIYKV